MKKIVCLIISLVVLYGANCIAQDTVSTEPFLQLVNKYRPKRVLTIHKERPLAITTKDGTYHRYTRDYKIISDSIILTGKDTVFVNDIEKLHGTYVITDKRKLGGVLLAIIGPVSLATGFFLTFYNFDVFIILSSLGILETVGGILMLVNERKFETKTWDVRIVYK